MSVCILLTVRADALLDAPRPSNASPPKLSLHSMNSYPSSIKQAKHVAFVQHSWERADPMGERVKKRQKVRELDHHFSFCNSNKSRPFCFHLLVSWI